MRCKVTKNLSNSLAFFRILYQMYAVFAVNDGEVSILGIKKIKIFCSALDFFVTLQAESKLFINNV